MDVLWEIIKAIFTPQAGETAEHYRSRAILNACLLALIFWTGFHTMLECGRLPGLFSGFATNRSVDDAKKDLDSQIAKVTDKIDSLIDDRITNAIRTAMAANCKAIKEGNADGAEFSAEELSKAENAWKLTHNGSDAAVPSCLQLGYK